MKIRTIISLISAVFITNFSFAQLSDLVKIDYTILPRGNSEIEYSRIRGLFNYPIQLKKEGSYLLLGLDYSNIKLVMDAHPSFNKEALSDFQLLDLNIGYTAALKNDWRLGVRLTPGFSSNLTADDLSLEDVIISGDVVFIKDKTKDKTIKKPWRLILGASYSGNRGYPFPLPFISYYRKFHSKWSYNIGIPKTNLQYHASSQHRFKLYAELDGFTANLQQGVTINNTLEAESINMSLVLGGLQYEYHISKHIQFYARGSYLLNNSVNLRAKNKDDILKLDSSNALYLRTGIRFKI
ncbi:hypothetical protein H7F37_02155 [Winogradskyella sp. PAMC22761]|nr:hypothetical protein H7F37_02155 [Winogradskyella sp. PAMC22761]